MSWDYCHKTSQLLQAAYATAKKKLDVVKFAKELPSMVDKFDQAEHAQRSGFERALHVLVKEQYWRADLSYGSGAKLSVFFTDKQAVEAAIIQAYPQAVVFQVMES